MKLISRMGLCLNLFYSCQIACHVCEHFFHLLEMYLWQQYLSWLRMNDASACKNICTFPRCSWEHLMNTNFWIQSKPSQTWIFLQSCISPAIYHHFQFEETVFAQKRVFNTPFKINWIPVVELMAYQTLQISSNVFSFSSI